MTHGEALQWRAAMRLSVLASLLMRFDTDKKAIRVEWADLVAETHINKNNIPRCMGDLGKAIPMGAQLNEELDLTSWMVTKPTFKQVAAAIEIARTDGTCTSWLPEV
jgi:hypothetical protein